jgi:hypothetical protein
MRHRNVASGTSYQSPIRAYLHGPIRSLIWVKYGFGLGNAFVVGHDLGYLVVYARTNKNVSDSIGGEHHTDAVSRLSLQLYQ